MLKSPQQIAALMTPNQIKPPQWFNQMYGDVSPEMTATPELWRDCVVFFPFWENSATPSSVGPIFLTTARTNTPKWISSEKGMAFNAEGSSQEGINTSRMPPIGASEPLSVFAYFENRSTDDGFERVSEIPKAGGAALISYWGTGNRLVWTREGGSGDNTGDLSANSFVSGDVVHNVYTHEGHGGATFLYKDGEQIDTQTTQNAVDISSSSNLWLGRESDEAADSASTDFWIYAIWNRVLTQAEARILAVDPFIMLRPGGF